MKTMEQRLRWATTISLLSAALSMMAPSTLTTTHAAAYTTSDIVSRVQLAGNMEAVSFPSAANTSNNYAIYLIKPEHNFGSAILGNPNGVVSSLCSLDGQTFYMAGFFTAIDGQPASYVASYNMASKTLEQLPNGGVDGAVTSMICDPASQSLLIGGHFSGTKDESVKSRSIIRFETSSTSWTSVGSGGLNERVETIQAQSDGSAVVMGTFTASGDDSLMVSVPPQSMQVDVQGASFDGRNTVCNKDVSTVFTLDQPGSQVQYTFPIKGASLDSIRLINARDNGIKTFRLIAYPSSEFVELSYAAEQGIMKCSDNCPLPPGASLLFRVVRPITVDRIALVGLSGHVSSEKFGFQSIEIFQKNVDLPATFEQSNNSPCSTPIDARRTTKNGNWNVVKSGNREFLAVEGQGSLAYTYKITSTGTYTISVMHPGCISMGRCPERAAVEVSVNGARPEVLDQRNTEDRLDTVFTGTLQQGSEVKVEIRTTSPPAGVSAFGGIRFQRTSQSQTLNGFAVVRGDTITPLTGIPQLSSTVSSVAFLSSYQVALTGKTEPMNSIASSGGAYIVPNGGLNGPIYDALALSPDSVVFGGTFTATSDNQNQIPYVALLDTKESRWTTLAGGLDGTVRTIRRSGSMLFLAGDFTKVFHNATDSVGIYAPGFIAYNLDKKEFERKTVVKGSVKTATTVHDGWVIAGDIAKFYGAIAPGFASVNLDEEKSVSANMLGYSRDVVFPFEGDTLVASSRQAQVPGTFESLVTRILASGEETTLLQVQGKVKALHVAEKNVWAVGDGVNIFDVESRSNKSFAVVGTGVNAIASVGNTVYIGGSFSTIDTAACTSFCKWDGSKWNAIASQPFTGSIATLKAFDHNLWMGGEITASNGAAVTSNIVHFNTRTDGWEFIGPRANTASLKDVAIVRSDSVFASSIDATGQGIVEHWSGDRFTDISGGIFQATSALNLEVVGALEDHTNALGRNFLLAYGAFTLKGHGPANIAFYDGSSWSPLAETISSANAIGMIRSAAFFPANPKRGAGGLPWWAILLIALAAVFMFGLVSFGFVRVQKRRESKASLYDSPLPPVPAAKKQISPTASEEELESGIFGDVTAFQYGSSDGFSEMSDRSYQLPGSGSVESFREAQRRPSQTVATVNTQPPVLVTAPFLALEPHTPSILDDETVDGEEIVTDSETSEYDADIPSELFATSALSIAAGIAAFNSLEPEHVYADELSPLAENVSEDALTIAEEEGESKWEDAVSEEAEQVVEKQVEMEHTAAEEPSPKATLSSFSFSDFSSGYQPSPQTTTIDLEMEAFGMSPMSRSVSELEEEILHDLGVAQALANQIDVAPVQKETDAITIKSGTTVEVTGMMDEMVDEVADVDSLDATSVSSEVEEDWEASSEEIETARIVTDDSVLIPIPMETVVMETVEDIPDQGSQLIVPEPAIGLPVLEDVVDVSSVPLSPEPPIALPALVDLAAQGSETDLPEPAIVLPAFLDTADVLLTSISPESPIAFPQLLDHVDEPLIAEKPEKPVPMMAPIEDEVVNVELSQPLSPEQPLVLPVLVDVTAEPSRPQVPEEPINLPKLLDEVLAGSRELNPEEPLPELEKTVAEDNTNAESPTVEPEMFRIPLIEIDESGQRHVITDDLTTNGTVVDDMSSTYTRGSTMRSIGVLSNASSLGQTFGPRPVSQQVSTMSNMSAATVTTQMSDKIGYLQSLQAMNSSASRLSESFAGQAVADEETIVEEEEDQ